MSLITVCTKLAGPKSLSISCVSLLPPGRGAKITYMCATVVLLHGFWRSELNHQSGQEMLHPHSHPPTTYFSFLGKHLNCFPQTLPQSTFSSTIQCGCSLPFSPLPTLVVLVFLIEALLRGVNVITRPSWLMALSSIGIYYPSAIFSFLCCSLSNGPIPIFNWDICTFSFTILVCEFLHILHMDTLFSTWATDVFSCSVVFSFCPFLCRAKRVGFYLPFRTLIFVFSFELAVLVPWLYFCDLGLFERLDLKV